MGRMFSIELSAITYYTFDEIEAEDEDEAYELAMQSISDGGHNFTEHYEDEREITEL